MAKVSGEVKVVYSAEDKATAVGKQVQRGLRDTGKASESVAGKMKSQWLSFANVMAVAVVAAVAKMSKEVMRALNQMVSAHMENAEALDKFIKQTGMAAGQLQRLKYAAEQESLEFEKLAKLFPVLAQRSMLAAQGNEKYAQAFRAMGVDVADSNGALLQTQDILLGMSEYMANEAIPAHEKLARARDLLGRSGADIVPFLKMGKDAIKMLGDEAERVGGIISTESIAIAKAFGDQATKMEMAMRGIRDALSTELLPYLYAFREWVVQNLPMIKEHFATVGAAAGKSVAVIMQYVAALWNLVERMKVSLGLLMEWFVKWIKIMRFIPTYAPIWMAVRKDLENIRKEGIKMQQVGLDNMKSADEMIRAFGKIITNIDETKAAMIKDGAFLMQEVIQGEVVEQINAEKEKKEAAEKAAKERLAIYEWLADKQTALLYEGEELKRQQVIKEYTEKAEALRLLGDYIGALKVEVQLTAELAKLRAEEGDKRSADIIKEYQQDKQARLERYLELLKKEKEAYREMVNLNEKLREVRKGIYDDSWQMIMDSANLAGDDLGRFAGLAMTGMKGAFDTGMGVDTYSLQMEELYVFYKQRVEAIQTQAQLERELLISKNATELELVQSLEWEKERIRLEFLERDLQATGLQQAQKLDMYQQNVNFTMGILGMLGSFADEQSQLMFAVEKAAAVASIIINSHKAAALALATVPPPGGQALASKYLAWGKIMAAATAAMAIKQIAAGTATPGGAMQGGAGYEYTQPEAAQWEEEKVSRTINVYVYGHIVDQDKFARELIPSLDKAFNDGVH